METRVLIVYAHQSCNSFNAAAKQEAVDVLTSSLNCRVNVSDLYAMNFKATATAADVLDKVCPKHFSYGWETRRAWNYGKLSADIDEEQHKLTVADLVIFQFPMYWFGVPAILKGWFDRVFVPDFAHTNKIYDDGPFQHKKAVLSFTTDCPESMFTPDGLYGDINVTLWPLQNGILHFCGFRVLAPQIFWAPASASPEARKAMLVGWRRRLEGLLNEEPISFSPIDFMAKGEPLDYQLMPNI